MIKPVIITMILLSAPMVGAGQDILLLDRLRVDVEALRSAERDFQRHQERGNMGTAESRDYTMYVDRLRQRVARDCMAMAAAEMVVPADLDCPQHRVAAEQPVMNWRQSNRVGLD